MLQCQAVSRGGTVHVPGLPGAAASSLIPAPAHAYKNAPAGRRVHLPSCCCWLMSATPAASRPWRWMWWWWCSIAADGCPATCRGGERGRAARTRLGGVARVRAAPLWCHRYRRHAPAAARQTPATPAMTATTNRSMCASSPTAATTGPAAFTPARRLRARAFTLTSGRGREPPGGQAGAA